MAQVFPSPSLTPDREPVKRPSSAQARPLAAPSNRHDHPYLIRTTSSSLLTRSNSVGATHKPPVIAAKTPASPALGRSQGRGHKHTKSQTSVPPLPLPPSTPTSPTRSDNVSTVPLCSSPTPDTTPSATPAKTENRGRVRRSGTLPSIHQKPSDNSIKLEDLPTNPKAWSSVHLATYLSATLHVKGGGSLPVPVVRDIANFVVNQKLSGRVFLRLTPRDVEDMGINQLWRPALLTASRNLRQNVVQGRIWGFGNVPEQDHASRETQITSDAVPPAPAATSAKHASLPSVPSTVFEDTPDDVSDRSVTSAPGEKVSTENLAVRNVPTRSRSGSNRVKDLVANFERSTSGGRVNGGSTDESFSNTSLVFSSPKPMGRHPLPRLRSMPDLSRRQTVAVPISQEEIPSPVTSEEAGFASGELTSGSEAGDDCEDYGVILNDTSAILEEVEEPLNLVENQDERSKHDLGEESDPSPASSILPRTPPPLYASPGMIEGDSDAATTSDTTSESSDAPADPRSNGSTIILTSRRNPSYIAHISKDSGSDDTVENLIASFNSADHSLAASWGANAWLESTPPGSTAKKLRESNSNSRKGSRPTRERGERPRAPLAGLFDEPVPLAPAAVIVDTNAPTVEQTPPPPANDEPLLSIVVQDFGDPNTSKIEALKERHGRQEVLLDEFRSRLEEVEKRLEEMEVQEATREAERKRHAEASTSVLTPVIPDRSPKPSIAPLSAGEEDDDWEDPSPTGLPGA
ncbi:hypothetical protein FRB99_006991 [Tulasnella sp. 403]|nr:hypothetical protein FRB99_006991 [Tulasnella sp. 403]